MNTMIENTQKIGLFFNSNRGLQVFKKINRKFAVDIYLSKKNLNKSVLNYLKQKKIRFKILNKLSDKFISIIKKKKYFLLISAGFPLIFQNELIKSSKNSTINLHAGPLPSYRGGSPLNWQIINGEKKIEINIIKMVQKVDAGPVYAYRKFKLHKLDTIKTVHEKVNKLFPIMVEETIKKIIKKKKPKKQPNRNIKIYKQRNDNDGKINWSKKNANEVYDFVRALGKPYPGAFYLKNKKRTRIFRCKISKQNPKILPGSIFYIKRQAYIKCKKYSIKIIN
jgi:methionyl-tRNA formyltransferase